MRPRTIRPAGPGGCRCIDPDVEARFTHPARDHLPCRPQGWRSVRSCYSSWFFAATREGIAAGHNALGSCVAAIERRRVSYHGRSSMPTARPGAERGSWRRGRRCRSEPVPDPGRGWRHWRDRPRRSSPPRQRPARTCRTCSASPATSGPSVRPSPFVRTTTRRSRCSVSLSGKIR